MTIICSQWLMLKNFLSNSADTCTTANTLNSSMTTTSRDVVGVDDIPTITAFLDEARALVGNNQGFLHAGDVWWRYGQYEPELHQLRLWFQANKLIALGWIISGHFEIQLHPTLKNQDFEILTREIIDWAKDVYKSEIHIDCVAENPKLIRVLESCGFVPNNDDHFLFRFDLKTAVPKLELPNGLEARHVLESEFEERVSVHRDAFNPSKFTLKRYARVRSMFGYKPELDLVIATPDNQFASFCLVWLSSGVGYFEPVGTRAAFRRQGLGRAVILEGFKQLQALGMQSAEVFSGGNNRTFYESCGFRVVCQFMGYAFNH